jgi:acyl-homoserine lactone acylase PvdQ
MRFIADMSGDVPNQLVLPMGESGVPTSTYYSDQLKAWAENQLYDTDWSLFSSKK